MTLPNSSELFDGMRQGLEPEPVPGYLDYWEARAHNNPDDERIRQIVVGLTNVALRGMEGVALYTNREPALQARYWYRALGPLNPLRGVEPDLVRATSMMYGATVPKPSENANLQLDAAYSLSELARVSQRPTTVRDALLLARDSIVDITTDPNHANQEATYRLQAAILDHDIRQDIARLRHTGQLQPKPLDIPTYRSFEETFVREEMRGINNFSRLVQNGIAETNFGLLLEWYFIMARRHMAWKDEAVDVIKVRGASSRENAEWTGEDDINPNRITGNHDVVIETFQPDAEPKLDRFQLKTVLGQTTYHPRVTVLDFQKLLSQRYSSLDRATEEVSRKLIPVYKDYTGALS